MHILPVSTFLPGLIGLALMVFAVSAAPTYPPKMKGATVETYKKTPQGELKVWIFQPDKTIHKGPRPAVVFFFGGGWRSGSPMQFQQHCKHLAERGFVAMTADYRVFSRHKTTADACVEDAKSAVRWIREHAKRLEVDPKRVAAGGGSAGGHLAACTGTVKGFEGKKEKHDISSVPNAMVLFNPACVLAPVEGMPFLDEKKMGDLKKQMGVDPIGLSPFHHVTKGAPPTLIFHGRADVTVPYMTSEKFAEAMTVAGNDCRLIGFDDMPHGFFNHGRYENRPYLKTIMEMDAFFRELSWIEKKAVAKDEKPAPDKVVEKVPM